MTTRDGSDTAILPAIRERRAPGRIRMSPAQRRALEFLRARTDTTAKVLVGPAGTGKTTIVNKACSEYRDYTVLRTSGGAGATSSFLGGLLQCAGLQPEQLSRAEQEKLLGVFLDREKAKGRRILIAVDGAERLSEEEWSELERLHGIQLEGRVSLELIVAGRPEINRHIRSPVQGWRSARTRFHSLGGADGQAPADTPRQPARLIIGQDGDVVETAPLGTRTLIGRHMHNDVALPHLSVSRHHAVVVDTPIGHFIVDLHSKNGLEINGDRAACAELRHGDVISLGVYRIEVMIWGAGASADPRPASSLAATATHRVKALRRHLEKSLRDVMHTVP